MRRLSERQQRILDFLRDFVDEHGYPPSIRDICAACNISSTSVVDYNLKILEREGLIRRDPEVSRGIEIIGGARRQSRTVTVPVLGTIAAGQPIPVPTADSWQTISADETIEISPEMARGRQNIYALRVKGTSMIDALINDGDLVLLEPAQTAENGEMVAAWLVNEKETTLKRFYHEGSRIRLQPANSTMAPLYVDAQNVQIQGKVIGVIRQM